MLPPVKLVRGCLNNGIFKETLPDYPLQNVRFTLLADAHIPPPYYRTVRAKPIQFLYYQPYVSTHPFLT